MGFREWFREYLYGLLTKEPVPLNADINHFLLNRAGWLCSKTRANEADFDAILRQTLIAPSVILQ